jgi:hypothetical protein
MGGAHLLRWLEALRAVEVHAGSFVPLEKARDFGMTQPSIRTREVFEN